jgi:hypothetical protein
MISAPAIAGRSHAMDTAMLQTAVPLLTLFALEVLGAIALWIVGRMLIRFAVRMLVRSLWQVYFDTNRTIRGAFGVAGFPAADQPIVIRTDGARPVGATR